MSSAVVSRRARTASAPLPAEVALEYRPSTYFAPWSTPAIAAIVRSGRRAALRAGREPVRSAAASDACIPLAEEVRGALERIHPALTEGAFLPTLQPCETEIARITFASTTHDVTAVYARQRKDGVFYRVVDEYGGRTLSAGRCARFSRRPLTLRQLHAFLAGACPAFAALGPCDRDDPTPTGCDVRAASEFYPGWADLVRARVGAQTACRITG